MTGKTLVTGATGFVGRPLVDSLVGRGIEGVRALGKPVSRPPVSGWKDVLIGDIDRDTDWSPALEGVNTVIHLAARVHVMDDGETDSLARYTEVNVDGTMNLARQAAEAGVQRFIFLSSVKVLGESTDGRGPFVEADAFNPLDPYAISKVQAEHTLREIASATGLEVVIIRPPLVYGPGVKGNFQTLVSWVRRGVPLPLGLVDNRRSLLALDNLVDLIAVCLDHPAAANQTFLAGDGESVSTPELLRRVGRAFDVPVRLFAVPERLLRASAGLLGQEDALRRLSGSLEVDIGKAKEVLGWRPPVTMEAQLARMVEDEG